MIPYIIIHTDFLVHSGLKTILSQQINPQYVSKGYYFSVKDALNHLVSDDTKLIFLGLNESNDDNLSFIELIKKKLKQSVILLMGTEDKSDIARKCLIKGALGYVYNHCTEVDLLESIKLIISNNVALPQGFRIHPNLNEARNTHRTPHKLDFELTAREKEILFHIANGLNNKDISKKLFISDQTVAVHRKNLFRKMGVKNSISLVKMAKERRMIA